MLLRQADSVSSLPPATRWRLSALAPLLTGDAGLAESVANVLAVEAEQTALRSRVPALWYARGLLLAGHQTTVQTSLGPVEDSLRRALLAEPGYGRRSAPSAGPQHAPISWPTVLWFTSCLMACARAWSGPAVAQKRSCGHCVWGQRKFEARDAASALQTYKHLRQFAPDRTALVGRRHAVRHRLAGRSRA